MKNNAFEDIITGGKNKEIVHAVKAALESGADPVHIINDMTDAMKIVGDRFQSGKIQLSDMFSSAQTMKKGVSYVTPLIKGESEDFIGKAIIGMAKGDLHDIGKGLVVTMLESVGVKVIDLGIDVPPSIFANALRKDPEIKIILICASLDSTIPEIKNTIDYLVKEKLRDDIKIIVGGASITEEIALSAGADIYTPNATLTAVAVKDLLLG